MKAVAFKPNAGKMGFRELFRVAGSPGVGLFACGLKFFRVLGASGDGYGMRSFGDDLDRVDPDALPAHVRRAMDNYAAKLERAGFDPKFGYGLECYGKQEAWARLFVHEDRRTAASIAYARCVRDANETLTVIYSFNTMLRDDTYVITSGGKRLISKPAAFRMEYVPGGEPKQVFARHEQRVEKAASDAREIRTDGDLERLVLNCENAETDFNLQRGVFVPMTRADIALGTRLKEEYDDESRSGPGRRKARKKDEEEEEEDEEEDEEDEEEDEDYDEDEPDDESRW